MCGLRPARFRRLAILSWTACLFAAEIMLEFIDAANESSATSLPYHRDERHPPD
jgi:hypothetical protein